MTVRLDHLIIAASDKHEAAAFLASILGLDDPKPFGPFMEVVIDGISFDFSTSENVIESQHLAFLVSEDEFDDIYGRIVSRGVRHWADPGASRPGQINTNDGGRGVYFEHPDGHFLEIITRPYSRV